MKETRALTQLLARLAAGWGTRLAARVVGPRYLVRAGLAERLRRHRSGAVAAICAVACLYVLAAFAADMLVKSAPTAAHDAILRHRLSSPEASRAIVIVDIDERALASLAPQHGRWPWQRDVLAGALEKINGAGARAVLFNVMMSDADRDHPEADGVMAFAAATAPNVAFPMVRLAAENDARSKIAVAAVPGARANGSAATVALIVPVFDTMHARMGVINQQPDADGIVRRYPVWWSEKGWALPSAVLQTLAAGGVQAQALPGTVSLNWRNKRGSYQRISLADLLSEDAATVQRVGAQLSGAWVVLGASAPGIGQVKATPVAAVTDDNEILATALDDTLHGTYLRIPPQWLTLVVTLAAIVLLGGLAILQVSSAMVNNAFLAGQALMSGVTLLCASYTNYLVDLSQPISLLLVVFSAIKMVQVFEQKNWRGLPSYFDLGCETYSGTLHLVGYLRADVPRQAALRLRKGLEKAYGVKSVLCIDNLFGDEHMLREISSDYTCLIVIGSGAEKEALAALIDQLCPALRVHMKVEERRIDAPLAVRSARFSATVMLWIVSNASSLIERHTRVEPEGSLKESLST
jgi:CHASE2 domain-containing sensor protein